MKKGCLVLVLLGIIASAGLIIVGSVIPDGGDTTIVTPSEGKATKTAEAAPVAPPATPFPDRSFWPQVVTISDEQTFIRSTPSGNVSVKVPGGETVDVADVRDETTIFAKRGEMSAEIPIDATDFRERAGTLAQADANAKAAAAAAKKQAEEEAAAKQAAAIAKHGPKPVGGDGLFGAVLPSAAQRVLRNSLKDPDSLKILSASEPRMATKDGQACWVIGFRYSATNSFGARTAASGLIWIYDHQVLALETD